MGTRGVKMLENFKYSGISAETARIPFKLFLWHLKE